MGIKYLDRLGNQLVENAPGVKFLNFLYSTNPLGRFSLWVLVKRKFFSVLFGRYMSSSRSKKKIQPFIERHQMDMTAYVEPEGGYRHFNDFFYRKIKPEFRPIGEGFVSPADGRAVVFQNIDEEQKFYIKGQAFYLEKFLGRKELVDEYKGGSMLVVRLAPVDYHRYHFPASGDVGKTIVLPGHFYSVSPIALKRNWEIFWRNQRSICFQKTKEFGTILISEIAATLTGSIVSTNQPNSFCEKGSEKGHFAFGGSTVVVLIPKGKIKWDDDMIRNTNQGIETYVQMGESIGQPVHKNKQP